MSINLEGQSTVIKPLRLIEQPKGHMEPRPERRSASKGLFFFFLNISNKSPLSIERVYKVHTASAED